MFSPLRRLRVILFCLLAFTSLALTSHAQNVTTWHNDINRTGWQQNETTLTQSNVSQSTFGLLWQWTVSGHVLAQPLAVANVPTQFSNCTPSCNLVFISTEMDMLYAFNAAPSAQSLQTRGFGHSVQVITVDSGGGLYALLFDDGRKHQRAAASN